MVWGARVWVWRNCPAAMSPTPSRSVVLSRPSPQHPHQHLPARVTLTIFFNALSSVTPPSCWATYPLMGSCEQAGQRRKNRKALSCFQQLSNRTIRDINLWTGVIHAAEETAVGVLFAKHFRQWGGEQRRRRLWRVWAENAHLSGACLPPPAASPGPAACAFSLSPPGNSNGPHSSEFWRSFPYSFGQTNLSRIGSWCYTPMATQQPHAPASVTLGDGLFLGLLKLNPARQRIPDGEEGAHLARP